MDVYFFVKKVCEIKYIEKNYRIILIDKNFLVVWRKMYFCCKDIVMIYLFVKYFFNLICFYLFSKLMNELIMLVLIKK